MPQYYFRINGIDDESSALKIEKTLDKIASLDVLEVDFETEMAVINSEKDAKEITSMINALGYNAILIPE